MSIVNRRNAIMGWAVWTLGKQAMKRKAKSAASVADTGSSRRNRVALGLGAAAAATATTVFFWRKKGDVEDAAERLG
jgi:hypothetical protein